MLNEETETMVEVNFIMVFCLFMFTWCGYVKEEGSDAKGFWT